MILPAAKMNAMTEAGCPPSAVTTMPAAAGKDLIDDACAKKTVAELTRD